MYVRRTGNRQRNTFRQKENNSRFGLRFSFYIHTYVLETPNNRLCSPKVYLTRKMYNTCSYPVYRSRVSSSFSLAVTCQHFVHMTVSRIFVHVPVSCSSVLVSPGDAAPDSGMGGTGAATWSPWPVRLDVCGVGGWTFSDGKPSVPPGKRDKIVKVDIQAPGWV